MPRGNLCNAPDDMNLFPYWLPGTLRLEAGPASIIPPRHVDFIKHASTDENVVVCQVDNEHAAGQHLSYFIGDFSGFHLYVIVTHTKVSILPESVRQHSVRHFEAVLEYRSESGSKETRLTQFRTPALGAVFISATAYGEDLNAFCFHIGDGSEAKYPCDLSFLSNYSDFPMSLRAEYIGLSTKNGRTADKRLADGHEKLQRILADQQSYNEFRTASILFYKPGALKGATLKFDEVVETLEASLIQHFQTRPLNVEHLNFPLNKTDLVRKLRQNHVTRLSVQMDAPLGCAVYSRHRPEQSTTHEFVIDIPQGGAKKSIPKRKRK